MPFLIDAYTLYEGSPAGPGNRKQLAWRKKTSEMNDG